MEKKRLLLIGPPGSGKGTQSALICQAHSLLHLSTGDLLRAEVTANSPLGQQAAEVMNRGELVSDGLVLAIVQEKLKNHVGGWILDGFPRNVVQARSLANLLEQLHQPLDAVVFLDLTDDELISRLLARGRADDNEAVIRHRLDVYREKTAPLINHYLKKGLLMTVEALGTIDEINSRIEDILN